MTASDQITKRKFSLLQLAEELCKVSKTSQLMGYHRDSFYEIKRAFQMAGVAGLVEQKRGPRGFHHNRVTPEVEATILDFCLKHPTKGSQFVANQLRLSGVEVSPSGVRGVWQRHDILKRHRDCSGSKPMPATPPTLEGIEPHKTKIATPRTNGFVEHMNRTLLDECFRVARRQTWHITPAEIERDLDTFLRYYNIERSHQGYRLRGRTPAQALREALTIQDLPPTFPNRR